MRSPASLAQVDVCFLAGTLGQGGSERQLYYTLQALREGGASVRLLSLTQGEFYEAPIRALGVPVDWVGAKSGFVRRLHTIMGLLSNLNPRPQFLQSQHFYTNLYVALAARGCAIREIGTMRSDGRNDVRSVGRVLGGVCLSLPRRVAANSQSAIEYARSRGVDASRLQLIPNAIDTARFIPRSRPLSQPWRVLGVGRLGPEKRFDRFIRVIAHLRQKLNIPVSGLLVGDGPLRSELERLAGSLGLAKEGFEFRGSVAEMGPVYGEADLLVMTSEYEGTPNVILEAMASGVPVVATEVGGIPFLIESDRTGILVPKEADDACISEAVLRVLQNGPLRQSLTTQGLALIRDRYSLAALPGHLLRLYQWGAT